MSQDPAASPVQPPDSESCSGSSGPHQPSDAIRVPPGKELTLFLYPDGSVAHLHHDDVAVTCFGPPTIQRASHVEPNAASTGWEVRLPESGRLIATADRRDEALQKEVEILTTAILPNRTSARDQF